MIVHMV